MKTEFATVPDLGGVYIKLDNELPYDGLVCLGHRSALDALAALSEAVLPVARARALGERLLRLAAKHEAEAEAARRKAVVASIDTLGPEA
jgi:hypothetical protein